MSATGDQCRSLSKVDTNVQDVQIEPPAPQISVRRSQRVSRPPEIFTPSLFYLLLTDSGEPESFEEAMQDETHKQWEHGMDEEMDSLEQNQTWDLVKFSSKVKGTLQNKWVYRIKEEEGGQKRYKARLVVKGFTQKAGIEFGEIFSPVVKMTSIHIVLSLVAIEYLHLEQLDVKMTFLHGDLEEEIYMQQSLGYEVKGKEKLVCKLKKSLYGLKQTPRQWYMRFDSFMHEHGYMRCESDHCVYFKKLENGSYIILLLYVDDMFIAGSSMQDIVELKEKLAHTFAMKDLGAAKKILGMQIHRDRKNMKLYLSLEHYINKVLERPDIAQAVGVVSRFMANLGKEHWKAVQWILRCFSSRRSKTFLQQRSSYFALDGKKDYEAILALGRGAFLQDGARPSCNNDPLTFALDGKKDYEAILALGRGDDVDDETVGEHDGVESKVETRDDVDCEVDDIDEETLGAYGDWVVMGDDESDNGDTKHGEEVGIVAVCKVIGLVVVGGSSPKFWYLSLAMHSMREIMPATGPKKKNGMYNTMCRMIEIGKISNALKVSLQSQTSPSSLEEVLNGVAEEKRRMLPDLTEEQQYLAKVMHLHELSAQLHDDQSVVWISWQLDWFSRKASDPEVFLNLSVLLPKVRFLGDLMPRVGFLGDLTPMTSFLGELMPKASFLGDLMPREECWGERLQTETGASEISENALKDFEINARFHTSEVLHEYPHDRNAFTQGLEYSGNGTLYESTGLNGRSSVREVHLQTGKVQRLHRMKDADFGEGLTLLAERLFQLTWLTNVGYMYDQFNFSKMKSFRHPMKDGWGLANDGKNLFGSDGSSTMYCLEPVTFREKYRVTVKYEGLEVLHLNELEYINGEVWANVWQSDCIARISPKDGTVLGWLLLHKLRKSLISSGYKSLDVLNGIAWDKKKGRLF
ncbi:hypothetical protein KI387_035271, partial [Taxus chinensis]